MPNLVITFMTRNTATRLAVFALAQSLRPGSFAEHLLIEAQLSILGTTPPARRMALRAISSFGSLVNRPIGEVTGSGW